MATNPDQFDLDSTLPSELQTTESAPKGRRSNAQALTPFNLDATLPKELQEVAKPEQGDWTSGLGKVARGVFAPNTTSDQQGPQDTSSEYPDRVPPALSDGDKASFGTMAMGALQRAWGAVQSAPPEVPVESQQPAGPAGPGGLTQEAAAAKGEEDRTQREQKREIRATRVEQAPSPRGVPQSPDEEAEAKAKEKPLAGPLPEKAEPSLLQRALGIDATEAARMKRLREGAKAFKQQALAEGAKPEDLGATQPEYMPGFSEASQGAAAGVGTWTGGLLPALGDAYGLSQGPDATRRTEQLARGAGALGGFVTGAPEKVGAEAFARTAGRLLEPAAGNGVGTVVAKSIANQTGRLASAFATQSVGTAVSQPTLLDAAKVEGEAMKDGAAMGLIFGGVGYVRAPKALEAAAEAAGPTYEVGLSVAEKAARWALASAANDFVTGQSPMDDRDWSQKVFDYGLNAYFMWHRVGDPRAVAQELDLRARGEEHGLEAQGLDHFVQSVVAAKQMVGEAEYKAYVNAFMLRAGADPFDAMASANKAILEYRLRGIDPDLTRTRQGEGLPGRPTLSHDALKALDDLTHAEERGRVEPEPVAQPEEPRPTEEPPVPVEPRPAGAEEFSGVLNLMRDDVNGLSVATAPEDRPSWLREAGLADTSKTTLLRALINLSRGISDPQIASVEQALATHARENWQQMFLDHGVPVPEPVAPPAAEEPKPAPPQAGAPAPQPDIPADILAGLDDLFGPQSAISAESAENAAPNLRNDTLDRMRKLAALATESAAKGVDPQRFFDAVTSRGADRGMVLRAMKDAYPNFKPGVANAPAPSEGTPRPEAPVAGPPEVQGADQPAGGERPGGAPGAEGERPVEAPKQGAERPAEGQPQPGAEGRPAAGQGERPASGPERPAERPAAPGEGGRPAGGATEPGRGPEAGGRANEGAGPGRVAEPGGAPGRGAARAGVLSHGQGDERIGPGGRFHQVRGEYTRRLEAESGDDVYLNGFGLNEIQQQGFLRMRASVEGPLASHFLADGTGVGKTRQLLAMAKYLTDRGNKVVYVAPQAALKIDMKAKKIAGTLGKEAAEFGVPVKIHVGFDPVEPGLLHVMTIEKFQKLEPDPDLCVIADEAHFMKNVMKGTGRALHGMRMMNQAKVAIFATATPIDEPQHLPFLQRIGVYEGQTERDAMRNLGMIMEKAPNGKGSYWKPVNERETDRRLGLLFDRLTYNGGARTAEGGPDHTQPGTVTQRELAMEATLQGVDGKVGVNLSSIPMPNEVWDVVQKILDGYARHPGASFDEFKGMYKARVLHAVRRAMENYKIPATVTMVKKALADGRQAVVFLDRTNESEAGLTEAIRDRWGNVVEEIRHVFHKSEGTVPALLKALKDEGLVQGDDDVAQIHSNKSPKQQIEAMKDFQSGKRKIVVATIGSGATGIDLDDQKGDKPRTMIVMTAPFSALEAVQAMGRVWRQQTQSFPETHFLHSELDIDRWNMGIIARKLNTLGAALSGPLVKTLALDDVPTPADLDRASQVPGDEGFQEPGIQPRQRGNGELNGLTPESVNGAVNDRRGHILDTTGIHDEALRQELSERPYLHRLADAATTGISEIGRVLTENTGRPSFAQAHFEGFDLRQEGPYPDDPTIGYLNGYNHPGTGRVMLVPHGDLLQSYLEDNPYRTPRQEGSLLVREERAQNVAGRIADTMVWEVLRQEFPGASNAEMESHLAEAKAGIEENTPGLLAKVQRTIYQALGGADGYQQFLDDARRIEDAERAGATRPRDLWNATQLPPRRGEGRADHPEAESGAAEPGRVGDVDTPEVLTDRQRGLLEEVGRHVQDLHPDEGEWLRRMKDELPQKFHTALESVWTTINHDPAPAGRGLDEPRQDESLASQPAAVNAIRNPFQRAAVSQTATLAQSPGRVDLLQRMRDFLKFPIGGNRGLIGQPKNVLAHFVHRPGKSIDMRNMGDIQTLAHEVGHYISNQLFGPQYQRSQSRAQFFNRYRMALDQLSQTHGHPTPEEGFAEFTRLYMTNPQMVRQDHLTAALAAEFDRRLMAKDPDLFHFLDNWAQDYRAWRGSDLNDRIKGKIAFDPVNTRPDLRDTMSRVYMSVFSNSGPIERMVKDMSGGKMPTKDATANVLRDLLQGTNRLAELFLFKGRHDEGGAIDFDTRRRTGKALEEVIQPIKDNLRDWSAYMIEKRLHELLTRDDRAAVNSRRQLYTALETNPQEVMREVDKWEKTHPEFKQAHDDFQEWNQNLLEYFTKGGMLSPTLARTFAEMNKSYFPFYRVFSTAEQGRDLAAQGGGVGGPKRLKGSGRDFLNPLEGAIRNAYTYIKAAEKNQVLLRMANMAQDPKMSEASEHGGQYWMKRVPPQLKVMKVPPVEVVRKVREDLIQNGMHPDVVDSFLDALGHDNVAQIVSIFRADHARLQPNEVVVMRRGQPEHYILNPLLKQSVDQMMKPEADLLNRLYGFIPTAWGKTVAKMALEGPARMLRAGATLAPEFALRNPFRDVFDRAWFGDRQTRVPLIGPLMDLTVAFAQVPRGALSSIRGDKWRDAWLRGGGEMALASMDPRALQRKLDDVVKGRPSGISTAGWVLNPIQWMRAISTVSEEANRIEEFRRVLTGLGADPDTATKEQLQIAAHAGLTNPLDFGRMGTFMKWTGLNRIAAFSNVSLASWDKVVRELKGPNWAQRLNFAVSAITIPSLLLWYHNHDDARWDDIPQWQRDLAWIYFTKKITQDQWDALTPEQRVDPNVVGHVFRFPKPWQLGIMFGSVPERIADWAKGVDKDFVPMLWQTLSEARLNYPIPTSVQTIWGLATNQDSFTGRPVISRGMQDLEPEEQIGPGTHQGAIWLAHGISTITGGTAKDSLRSPQAMDYIFYRTGGNLGRLGLDLIDIAGKALQDLPPEPAATAADVPGLRGFVTRYPTSASESIENFYKELTTLQSIGKSAKFREKSDRDPEGYAEKHALELAALPAMTGAAKQLSELRAQMRAYQIDREMSPEEKRKAMDQTTLEMIDAAREALQNLREARSGG